ncbi:hypothetical protein M2480_000320 [Parabacteroides sp. PFB2-12]|nr:hypothetical protein [Parabacteroides sp. PM6-13]MDH6389360.1 hypothetical protein [Parabacteroides sp. PFB2-12]
MSYTQIYCHIVLRTKNSKKSIQQHNISELYKYIWGIIKNKKKQAIPNQWNRGSYPSIRVTPSNNCYI